MPLAIAAQETRGNISGTVRDAQGVVPGAMVAVTNVDTQVSQNLVTNDSGHFEAPLLNPGNYTVTVQMAGFRTATRTNVVLGVGQQLTVPFMLEVGTITEEVIVRAETPLLDTSSLSSGANFDSRLVDSLPMFSNMPITGLKQFKPTDVGLPAYLDEFCSTKGGCTLPSITIGGYQPFGGGLSDGDTATHMQGQSTITSVKGRHTLHGGVDVRRALRRGRARHDGREKNHHHNRCDIHAADCRPHWTRRRCASAQFAAISK